MADRRREVQDRLGSVDECQIDVQAALLRRVWPPRSRVELSLRYHQQRLAPRLRDPPGSLGTSRHVVGAMVHIVVRGNHPDNGAPIDMHAQHIGNPVPVGVDPPRPGDIDRMVRIQVVDRVVEILKQLGRFVPGLVRLVRAVVGDHRRMAPHGADEFGDLPHGLPEVLRKGRRAVEQLALLCGEGKRVLYHIDPVAASFLQCLQRAGNGMSTAHPPPTNDGVESRFSIELQSRLVHLQAHHPHREEWLPIYQQRLVYLVNLDLRRPFRGRGMFEQRQIQLSRRLAGSTAQSQAYPVASGWEFVNRQLNLRFLPRVDKGHVGTGRQFFRDGCGRVPRNGLEFMRGDHPATLIDQGHREPQAVGPRLRPPRMD